ncbi:MAG: hypothetical protein AB7O24_05965 [Kofleriaceae bacterium]
MRDFRRLPAWLGLVVCLGFTGAGVAWAEDAQGEPAPTATRSDLPGDPEEPHHPRGTTARVGTSVGYLRGQHYEVLGLGLTTAVGQRFDRVAIEAEYTYLQYQETGPSTIRLGRGQRLGVIGRVDVVRFGPRWVGNNSMLALYVEGGAAVAWDNWYRPGYREPARVVPVDTKRTEGQLGMGMLIDHRLQKPVGYPIRIGWFVGWRVGFAPSPDGPPSVCRASGNTCRTAAMESDEAIAFDRSLLFQSSLSATW